MYRTLKLGPDGLSMVVEESAAVLVRGGQEEEEGDGGKGRSSGISSHSGSGSS